VRVVDVKSELGRPAYNTKMQASSKEVPAKAVMKIESGYPRALTEYTSTNMTAAAIRINIRELFACQISRPA